ncbi:MAG: acetate kinase, partial [Clostridiales bacterium]|nr:acetate kinase [Clostridiales bacterium]
LMNKKSGVEGLSGVSSDFRDLDKASKEGNERATLALEMFEYQARKIIGSYAAAMGGVDVIVFTAGIGENTDYIRAAACEGLGFMGVEIDPAKNNGVRTEAVISSDSSKVKVVIIPTNEELAIAQETEELVK